MSSALSPFAAAAIRAVATATGLPETDFKVDVPPRAELGDFAVGCFAAAKALKQAPPQVAARVAAEFQPTEHLASATAAGPFVNFRVDRAAAFRWLVEATLGNGRLVPAIAGADQTICIDYSSPNISKHLAYHHIRSTMIGHALVELHRALGYRVVGINHLGDWGTTHGMLMAAYHRWGADEPLDITKLNELYVRFRDAMKTDPSLEGEGRRWFKRLEDGDPEVRALWQRFRDISLAEFEAVYQMLGVHFDEVRGESAYEDAMPGVIEMLAQKGLTTESDGALVVPIEGEKTPLLLKTGDGTTLYATRDIATALYRWQTYQFVRSLYVVDRGQSLHFRQLFKVLGLAGYEWAKRCEHVPFGLVRFGGKKTSTRGGNVVLLKDVFHDAADEIAPRIREAHPEMPADELERTAQMVGMGAVVFANLFSQRDKDVDFEWERITSFEGDSGPYLQYSHARCASIQRKAGVTVAWDDATRAAVARLGTDAEWAVAKRLLAFGEAVARAAAGCEPHIVCHYLLDLAGDFSRWYTAGNGDASLRVLTDDAELRHARLALTAAVQATLRQGLALLGVGAPDVM
jgi:arginyl-tRNA synthetase